MKAKITSKTYYIAETEDGKKYSVDIRNPQIKFAFDNGLEIEGEVYREEKQDRYTNGEYARSYTVTEKFVPKKEKITINGIEHPIGKYEQKFGPEFATTMREIREEMEKEEKTKVQPQHISLPKKDSK